MNFTENFKALLREAAFTKEMLGAGCTQIRAANYASDGIYFQAFVSLATGLERLGKMCVLLDHFSANNGRFPDASQMKTNFGHDLLKLYAKSQEIVDRRSMRLHFQKNLDTPIHQAILSVLSAFNLGDRYANIDLMTGRSRQTSPIARWSSEVDDLIYRTQVKDARKLKIDAHARSAHALMSSFGTILHTAEDGTLIRTFYEGATKTGIFNAVAPYRQLASLQIVRYWTEVLLTLATCAQRIGPNDIPVLGEILGAFYNGDSYFRSRRTWDKL
jgi:hypothetical protein